MYYEDVFRQLNQEKIKYLVVGGIALNLYGVPRMTADLDLMLKLDSKNLLKFATTIEKLGYKPRSPVDPKELADSNKRQKWQKDKKAVVFSFYSQEKPYQQIDIFLSNPIDFKEASDDKKTVSAGGIRIPLISIDHLIKLKKESGRKQDLSDIEALKKIKKSS